MWNGRGRVERRLSPAPLCAPSVEARCQADLWIAGRLSAGSGHRVPLPVTLVCYVCLGSTACTGLTAGTSGAWVRPRAMPPAAGEAATGPGEVLAGHGLGAAPGRRPTREAVLPRVEQGWREKVDVVKHCWALNARALLSASLVRAVGQGAGQQCGAPHARAGAR